MNPPTNPLMNLPPTIRGSEIGDWNHLILDPVRWGSKTGCYDGAIELAPEAFPSGTPREIIRPFIGGRELLTGIPRWILCFYGIPRERWAGIPAVEERLERVRIARAASRRQRLVNEPWKYFEYRAVPADALVIPQVTSGRRRWIPIDRINGPVPPVINGKAFFTNWNPVVFSLLSSSAHIEWIRLTAGRLKADFSYSNLTTYNTFPPPPTMSDEWFREMSAAGLALLDARAGTGENLVTIYDPGKEPESVLSAHSRIDGLVDAAYGIVRGERLSKLLARYQWLNSSNQSIPRRSNGG